MGSPWLGAGPDEAVPNGACGVGATGLLFNDETIPEAIWLTSRANDAKQVAYLMLNPLSPDFGSASWSSDYSWVCKRTAPPRALLPCTGTSAAKAFGDFPPVLSNSGTHCQGPGKKLSLSQEGKKTETYKQKFRGKTPWKGEEWGAWPGHTGQVTEHTCRKGACKSGGVGAGATVVFVAGKEEGSALRRKSTRGFHLPRREWEPSG